MWECVDINRRVPYHMAMTMEWFHALTIAASTVGSVWYLHRESQKEMKGFHAAITDFHGRLCRLEEKYIQMMEREMKRGRRGKE